MKHITYRILFSLFAIWLTIDTMYATKIAYDQKYVTVGVFTNSELPQFTRNSNIRFYGNQKSTGNEYLKQLFNYSNGKPCFEYLAKQALLETTTEEVEIATQDVSAETQAILENDIVRQLLKNNYVVEVNRVINCDKKGKPKLDKKGKPKGFHIEWSIYHIDIDDEIIDQVFYCWNDSSKFSQINVPTTFVAKGKISESKLDRIIVEISKKVPAFAIRGPITQNNPTYARITRIQGARTGDRFRIYRMYEDNNGIQYSKKVSETRVLTTDSMQTHLKVFAGNYPNYKNGDIAALYGWSKSSITLQGQYSFGGDDPRIGGRITYEWMPKYTSKGVAHYISVALEYQQFKTDPDGVWFTKMDFNSSYVNPQLRDFGFYAGYGLGISFLTKFEITPYVLGGLSLYSFTGTNKGAYIWDADKQMFNCVGSGVNGVSTVGYTVYGGVRLAYNISYPLQLVLGAEYGASVALSDSENHFDLISKRHDLCRLNVFGGLRFNF